MWKSNNFTESNLDSDLDFRLKRALSSGDTQAFKRLVKGGVNVNSTYWYNSTLLHEAVQIGTLEPVEFLLQNKANVNSKNSDHRTPLHIACRGGLKNVVNSLLKYGADVNAQTMDKQTALHIAAWRGKDEIAKLLVNAGAEVNVYDKDGWLPIHWALRLHKEEMVDYFIGKGSHLDAPIGKAKRSPFLLAVIEKKYKIAQILLKHGADCTLRQKAVEIFTSIMKDTQMTGVAKQTVIQLLIRCGIICSETDLLKLADKCTTDEERNTLIQHCDLIDQSLAGICRSVVRGHLKQCCSGRSIYNSVQLLAIPKILKDYITFVGDYKVF